MRSGKKKKYDCGRRGAIRGAHRWRVLPVRSDTVVSPAVLIVASAFFASCDGQPSRERLRVVTSVRPLAGIVDRVAPGLTEISVMIPAGANPVTHEPTLSDLRFASTADVVFEVGHPALTWETTWLDDLSGPGAGLRVRAAAKCSTVAEDPHVWLSPVCARRMADTIAAVLAGALPAMRDSIRRSVEAFREEIQDVAAEAEARLAPHRGSAFLTLHPAWGYLAHEYGLEQLAILEHGSGDAGPGQLAAVIERARMEGLRNVIVQPQFAAEPAELVAGELGGEVLPLDPLFRDWPPGVREAIDVLAGEAVR